MATIVDGTAGVTFPAGGVGNPAGAVVGTTDTQTLTNKTITLSGLLTQAAGANIASAATIDLSTATGNGCRITGTTAISAVTMTTGQQVLVVADGALPLTYNATTNKLNSAAASVTLAAGDMVLYSKDLSGIVHGNIIKANGTSVVAGAASSPISTPDVKTTGTSATFTIPTGVTVMKVTVIGGGGAGGGAGQIYCGCPCGPGYFAAGGNGGGAGGAAITYLTGLTPGNTLAYTVGAGGTANSQAAGGSGGTSSVVSGTQSITSITCTGGAGGGFSFAPITPGAGGTATGGTINIAGSIGGAANGDNGAGCIFNGYGANVTGGSGSAVGKAATGYGSGGGGAVSGNPIATARVGGAGKAGIVIFEY